MLATRRIGPLDVVLCDRATALHEIIEAILARGPRLIGFANAHSVDLARADPAFARTCAGMTLFNDGVALDVWSRLVHGAPFPENLNGTDLTPAVLALLPADTAVYLLGSRAETVAAAAARVSRTYPNLRVAGFRDGFFAAADEPGLAAAIKASGADFVLAGMGQPRQELWAGRWVGEIGVPVLCIGALIEYLSGRVARAPGIVRTLRLEWAFRLAREPRRFFGRYVTGSWRMAAGIIEQRRGTAGPR